jgi:hypothetical protein
MPSGGGLETSRKFKIGEHKADVALLRSTYTDDVLLDVSVNLMSFNH